MKLLSSGILIMDEILPEMVMSISPLYITPVITAAQAGLVPSLGVQQRATPIITGFEMLKSFWEQAKEMGG